MIDHVHAEAAHLEAQRVGERLHRVLGRVVDAAAREGELAAHRADVHDPPAALRGACPAAPAGTSAAGRRRWSRTGGARSSIGTRLDRAALAVAGVVDERADRALGLLDRRHGRAHRVLVGHVERERAAAGAFEVLDRLGPAGGRVDGQCPRRARCSAVARPMPVEQPVIRTALRVSAMALNPLRSARARTSSVWAARPMRPRSSQSAVSVRPERRPRGVTASRHDPLALRRAQQVDAQVGVDEEVARASRARRSRRCPSRPPPARAASGDGSSPSTSGTAHAHPDRGRPGLEEARRGRSGTPSPCGSRVLAGGEEVALRALVGPGPSGGGSGVERARRRPRRARRGRASPRPPGPLSDASSSSTLRPGRTTRALDASSGASGTGPRISKVMRPTRMPSRGSQRSIARASSAAGGPACWAPGSQGPRVSSVGTSRSPSWA